ncbi:MAG: NfeD family protein [Desulfobacteraceae bacterium]|jgi:membrane protein implicated in regulation of membrane protease activity|nr:NfeD family protein [Desulfobacteraceae bacterium]
MKSGLITIFICIVIYEIFEHLILPLFWMIRYRKRKSSCGPSALIGKRCLVKKWEGNSGKVLIGSELWKAIGNLPLIPGDEVVVQDLEGLTLRVSTSERLPDTQKRGADKNHGHEFSK